ncbi:hypothetical protein ACSCBZ_20390 [Streptomyces niveiscabiei]|uniref:hypothetical protein n=1 Tax=Streptomyces niveiscabiei TaxID=164115 RepID=UPI000AAB1E10
MPLRVQTTRDSLPGTALSRLAQAADVVSWPGMDKPSPAGLATLAPGVSAILALGNGTVDAALMDAAGSALRVIAPASMRYDNADRVAAAERGITVTHARGPSPRRRPTSPSP